MVWRLPNRRGTRVELPCKFSFSCPHFQTYPPGKQAKVVVHVYCPYHSFILWKEGDVEDNTKHAIPNPQIQVAGFSLSAYSCVTTPTAALLWMAELVKYSKKGDEERDVEQA